MSIKRKTTAWQLIIQATIQWITVAPPLFISLRSAGTQFIIVTMRTTLWPLWNLRFSSPRSPTVSITKSLEQLFNSNTAASSTSHNHHHNNNPFEDDELLSITSDPSSASASFYSLTVGTEHGFLHHNSRNGSNWRGNSDSSSSYIDPKHSINLQATAYLDTNNNANNNSTPVFLLLVDDNRGSSGVCRSFSYTKTWDVYKIDAVFRG